ncbi:uncharacterized protein F5147DRAFT_748332 [Suillus discolor]|uniref:Uncharacterized protein n=1 Tax=Suillus discolor TaxID=1912936 RepID=A0A9P7ETQ3_9AGAM|nr:uncharacterized protein F5147DRAFT_748332 [Suillus discolor]KAG2089638.1 hypothetical protein F5147DRAFT_748332 [Suillus discolor]
MAPRKKVSTTDPLVSHRRHFGRTVFALLRLEQMEDTPLENFPAEERREHHVFEQLLESYPGLLERLKKRIGKGAAGARGDDTKTLKSAVLDWITPKGEAIQPPLHRNSKVDRGFNHELTGTKMNLRSGELWFLCCMVLHQAYKHVFTSPSSVEKEPKATRSGNACLHGMTSVTIASIAYIATQVRFALSSSSVFSRTDMTTDSETFYHSLLDLLKDPEESKEVHELLTWWNRQIFPTSSAAKRPISANSALSKIRQRHLALKQSSISNVATS